MKDIVNFLFEVGMLQKTPRTGFQFLGSGCESVAEHILRTIFIGYTLCKLERDIDESRVLKMCLFHDLPEARTGDMNYVNKKYVTVDEGKAVRELTETLFFGKEISSCINEFNEGKTKEARIVRDADQLALILQLKEYGDLGNKYSKEWIAFAIQRLRTEGARETAEQILETDSSDWWFQEKDDWWINGDKGRKDNGGG
ncbi:metal dependent phosphohydrolase [Syntrophus gentianae]|uniref:5'-deoxynucleotidase n=1 Tax=Syntrophus gentianae TaxID=43775 RepID=A0A1H7WQF9_9BACT|nr:HD domain-containing protein [Syntrophus gentianae]SEM23770.1 metal dependent phosphohydrolase [Syntrophus gentianae]